MSNPSDPTTPPAPDQPDPAKSEEAKAREQAEEAARRRGSSFEFQLPEGMDSYSDLPAIPQPDRTEAAGGHKAAVPPSPTAAPPATGSFDFIELPDMPPPASGDSSVLLEESVPTTAPSSFTLGDAVIDLANLPEIPTDEPASHQTTVPDIATLFPAGSDSDVFRTVAGQPEVPPAASGSFRGSPALSDVFDAAAGQPEVPPAASGSFGKSPALADLELPPADPGSDVFRTVAGQPEVPPAASGSFRGSPALSDVSGPAAVQPEEPPAASGSADLELPPADPGSAVLAEAVPDVPTAEPGSFVMDEPLPPASTPPAGGPTSPGRDADAILDGREHVGPVAPASGWLDSDVLPVPLAEPVAPVEPAAELPVPAPAVEGSDIFSGSRVAPALSVDQSDIIAATAYGPTPPAAPRPSDVALTFDAPPGGSTVQDGNSDDLPIAELFADEPGDSSAILGSPADDAESIHDMPDPAAADPLFDSARLADAPGLPTVPAPPPEEGADYGTVPTYTADASSILADLNEPHVPNSPDSSSVRVEAPGVDRTLTGDPAEGAFDLTVSDDPIPANLFDSSDGTGSRPTDWQSQSGSDLFSQGNTVPEIDLDAAKEESVEADLGGEHPSLSSAPSSIFSGDKPLPGSEAADLHTEPAEVDYTDVPPAPRAADAPRAGRKPSSADFELPPSSAEPAATDDAGAGAIDWDNAPLAGDENATRGISKDASLSAILRGLGDDSGENPTTVGHPAPPAAGDADEPVVTVDWMAGSAEGSAVVEAAKTDPEFEARPKPRKKDRGDERDAGKGRRASPGLAENEPKKVRPARAADDTGSGTAERAEGGRTGEEKRKAGKKGGGVLVGLFLGALFAGGAWAALYFGDVIPNAEKKVQTPPPPPPGGFPGMPGGPPGVPGPGGPPNFPGPNGPGGVPPVAADPRGTFAAGDTAAALELLSTRAPVTTADRAAAGHVRVFAKVQGAATDDDLKKGRADLEAVIGDADAAKSPEGLKRAVQATVTLGVSYEAAGDTEAARKLFTEAKTKYPAHAAVFEALLDRLDAPPAPGTSLRLTPAEVERALLGVSTLLADDAPKAEDLPEPGTFYWKAVKLGAEGKYTEAIALIGKAKAAHVARAKALAGRGLNPLTDPLEQMFPRACDELAASWKLRSELYGNPAVAEALKKDGVARTLDALAKAQTDLVAAKTDLAKKEKELKKVTDESDVRADLYKKAEAAANKKVNDLTEERDTLTGQVKKLKEAVATLKEAEAQVAEALKPAVKLPEKWGSADLVAGVKSAAARATGPDLKALVPGAMVAVGGGGLAAGQLLDIAERLNKAEAAAKAATEKLAADTKKLNDKYDLDTAKLKAAHAAEVKELVDSYAADTKKLKEEHATALTKLKDASAADIKKLTDKFAADSKKLTDDHRAAVTKLTADHEAALKAEQAKTEAEKKSAVLKEIGFQKQLANAVTPAQALDVWLPVLTDLRRPADADPALVIARRALAAALPDSEDAAKAHTVTGMALLLKGDLAGAKDEFQAARRNPTYTAQRPWAKVADTGLEAIDDPLAPYRRPVVLPPVDLKAATKALDTGIAAYRAGKYAAAAAALTDATKNDPTDPVAWYYLGAVRWARGNEEQAKKDFAQGAEREKVSPVPARTLNAALAVIQGAARDALDRARP